MLHYVHSSLVYNSQKMERAQMSLNRGMDTEMDTTFTKCSTTQLLRAMTSRNLQQMDGTRKYHAELGNPDPKVYTWYVFTDKWILAQKYPGYN